MRCESKTEPKDLAGLTRSQRYYQSHKRQIQARNEKWWKEHRDKLREKWRRRQKTPNGRAKSKRYREKHLAQVRLARIKWQKDNWKHRQRYMRAYYDANKETIKSHVKEWTKNNPGKVLIHNSKKRALRFNPKGAKAIEQYCRNIKSKPMARCYYCGKIVSTKTIHFDHVLALAKGGSHSVDNLCVACPFCNLSKHDSVIRDWYKLGQQILSL